MTGSGVAKAARVDPELLRRFDRSGPRYTSYPTAVEFHSGIGEADYARHLREADSGGSGQALSLYVHIPFCERLCSFCACHFIATPHRHVAATYLQFLAREVDLLAERLPNRRLLAQMQWGGGTPTYLSPAELERLFATIHRHFEVSAGAELAIEVDPRVTTAQHLAVLRSLGFNRLSMGVQDFTPAVQEAIGRRQTFEETRALVDAARALGFSEGINFDLIYGLPLQDETSFEVNLDRLLELRPDRVAMYSFAYVPWARPHQRRIEAATLPAGEIKLALSLSAFDRLLDAGYEPIGMDHFALPEDALAVAKRQGRLHRNFQGYSTQPDCDLIALGVSAIGRVGATYSQNAKTLEEYYDLLDQGRLPVVRGLAVTRDDLVRRAVIMALMCQGEVQFEAIELAFLIDFRSYFANELVALAELQQQGLVQLGDSDVQVTADGWFFVRAIAMVFDRYLQADRTRAKFSKIL